MPRLLKIASLLLLAAWLPATLHCQIEAAGLHTDADECCPHAADGCADTICPSVEENLIKDTNPLAVPTAPEQDQAPFQTVTAERGQSETAVIARLSGDHPPPLELTAGWQFARRAAPLG